MANTAFATGSNHNVLNWERKLNIEALKMAQFTRYMGEGPNVGIQVVSDHTRGHEIEAGDTVYTTLLMNLTGSGQSGDNDLQGNEESLVLYRQTVTINQLRQAVKSAGQNETFFIPRCISRLTPVTGCS